MAYVSVRASAEANSYKNTMKEMALEAKALASQWTATQAKAKAFGSEADQLRTKSQALSDKIKLQKEIVKTTADQYGMLATKLNDQKSKHDELKSRVDSARKAYEESANATGKNSEETRKLKDQLSQLERELQTNENSISQTERALNNQAIAANNAEAKLAGMEGELQDVNRELQDLNLDKFADGCEAAGKKIEDFGQKLSVMSAGLAAFAGASAESALNFENDMAKVSTIMDPTVMSLEEMEEAIISLSNETGIAAGDIADNVYNAISAGQSTADAVNFVRNSTKLATAGFAESGSTLDLLTTILNAYQLEASKTDEVSNMLIQTQNLGKTTVSELASSMGKIIPTANANGTALDQLCAGYAIMTANGIATAEATTYMNSMLNELSKTGSDTDVILRDKTGKSFKELMESGSSLADVLAIVDEEAKNQNLTMSDMFSSSEAAKAGLILLGDGASNFNETLAKMNDSAGSTDQAFEKMQTKSYDLQKSLNEMKNTAMQFGQTLLESAGPAIDMATDKIGELCEWYQSLDKDQQQLSLKIVGMGIAIGPATIALGKMVQGTKNVVSGYKTMRNGITGVVTAIKAKTAAQTAGTVATKAAAAGQAVLNAVMSANPIMLIVVAIAALAAGLIVLYKNSETFRNAVQNLWETAKNVFTNIATAVTQAFTALRERVAEIFTSISDAIANAFQRATEIVSQVFETIKNVITVAFLLIGEIINAAFQIITVPFMFIWENCKDFVFQAWEFIKNAVSTAINAVSTTISTVMETIRNVLLTIWNAIYVNVISPIINAISAFIATAWNVIYTTISTIITAVHNVLSTVWNAIKTVITTVLNAIKTVVTNIFNTIKNFATTTWNAIKTNISNAINSAKTTVSNTVENIKSTVSNVFDSILSKAQDTWNSIKNAIETPINNAKTAVSNAIDAMKRKFNFSWSLPHLSLPHFSISGSFSLNPPSVPSFSVSWYKTGAIMNSAMIFGMAGGRLLGGGEAGQEAILPLEGFYTRLNRMLDAKLEAVKNTYNVRVECTTYIDGEEVASKTKSKVNDEFVTDARKGR